MEDGNREHAANTPSINSNDDRECEGDLSHFTLVDGSTMEILEEDNEERAAKTDSLLSKGLIFRIPGLFKMRNKQAYTPYKFSIGPWHFGKTELLHTGQKLKEFFFERLINRFPDPAATKSRLEEAIKNVRGKVRECYEGGDVYGEVENIELEKILLLDGCFIIELFRKNFVAVPRGENESLLFSGGMMQVIYHDLLLLENQIPWFVLELLFDMTRNDLERMMSLITLVELAIKFFSCAISHYEPGELRRLQIGLEYRNGTNFIHLVDFVWHFLCFSSEMGEIEELGYREFEDRTLIPSVTRLKEAGVKFQKAESRNIMDVRFNKGVLEIPPLLITPSTETIFRNLIIFEQCSLRRPSVTCYAILLDCLVDTADDVDLMCRAGILNNWLNPEETAKFLNRVRDNTPIGEFFYVQLCKEVNRYCKKKWPRWRASLIHHYFTKPWAIVSVIFAMIVLFFTIMQVFYK